MQGIALDQKADEVAAARARRRPSQVTAAALELYEALKGARSVLRVVDRSNAWRSERDRVLAEVDALLAKVEA
jgi:hypothetical protein